MDPNCGFCRRTFSRAVVAWGQGARRTFPWRRADRSPFELTVAEILLQQTRAEKVAAVIPSVLERYPDWRSLANATSTEVETSLRPLGLQRRRAARLRELARQLVDRGGTLPGTVSELEQLSGVGQYTARAIRVQLAGERVAPIDANVARVLERVFGPRTLADLRYDPYLQQLALNTTPKHDPGAYFVSLLDFGGVVCTARNPSCDVCPIVTRCRSVSAKACDAAASRSSRRRPRASETRGATAFPT